MGLPQVIEEDFLQPYVHSNNDLGIVYHIPRTVGIHVDIDLIMETYIGCKVNYFPKYVEVICIHQGATKKRLEL